MITIYGHKEYKLEGPSAFSGTPTRFRKGAQSETSPLKNGASHSEVFWLCPIRGQVPSTAMKTD